MKMSKYIFTICLFFLCSIQAMQINLTPLTRAADKVADAVNKSASVVETALKAPSSQAAIDIKQMTSDVRVAAQHLKDAATAISKQDDPKERTSKDFLGAASCAERAMHDLRVAVEVFSKEDDPEKRAIRDVLGVAKLVAAGTHNLLEATKKFCEQDDPEKRPTKDILHATHALERISVNVSDTIKYGTNNLPTKCVGAFATSAGLASMAVFGCTCANAVVVGLGSCCLDPRLCCKAYSAIEDYTCLEKDCSCQQIDSNSKYDKKSIERMTRHSNSTCSKKLLKVLSYMNPWSYLRAKRT